MPEEEMQLPSSKGSMAGKVLQWVFVLSTVIGIASPWLFPETLATKGDEAIIHADVHNLKAEVKAELLDEIKEELKKSAWAHKQMSKATAKVADDLKNHKIDQESINEAAKLHRSFNTQYDGILSDIVWEELDLNDLPCEVPYRVSNPGDLYGQFPDMFESRHIYSVDQRSGCRYYFTPLFKDKQLIR